MVSLQSVIIPAVGQRGSLFFLQVGYLPVSFIIYVMKFHRRAHQLKHNHILTEN